MATGKRGHDEGSVFQRSDGRWCGSVSLGYGPDGKRLRKTVYGKTRREVAARLAEAQKAAQKGVPPENDAVTVARLMEVWLADVAKPSVRPKTYRSYEQLVRVHIVPALGHDRVAKVDARRVQAFLRERQEAGLSARTVQYLRAVLRQAFGAAVRWDWVGRNVVALTSAPRVERAEPPAFSPGQARALLAAFAGHRHGALLTVTMGLGLRIGEALGLRWEDVRLSEDGAGGTLSVRFQLQWADGSYRLVPPKSRMSRRTVSLPGFVAAALAAHRTEQAQEERAWREAGLANELGLVFTNHLGGPLHERNVRRDFYLLLERAGLERIRLHDLRHLCASLLLAQGVHPRVVMEILGHSQISLTMNTYSHVMPAATQEAARAIHGLITSAEQGAYNE